jgi:NAD(P)-dependent dehydrogenase (short-subunit alcohol dehydrogenase family)
MEPSPRSSNGNEQAKKKTVLITGCSQGGIGSSLALAFHAHGCRVFATARNLAKVQHLKDVGIEVLEIDVLDEKSCKDAAEWVGKETGGGLDYLVNNSGIGVCCFSFSMMSVYGVEGVWEVMRREADWDRI